MQNALGQWSRDWEHFNQSEVGRNEAEGLSNEELVEYLRWMACIRPEKYGELMTAFARAQGQEVALAV